MRASTASHKDNNAAGRVVDKRNEPSRTRKRKVGTSRRKRKGSHKKRINPITWLFVAIGGIGVLFCLWLVGLEGNRHGDVWVRIPADATTEAVSDSLSRSLGGSFAKRVYILWKAQGGNPAGSHGAYLVSNGETALKAAHRIARGRQTPVTLTFNNVRTMKQLSEKIAGTIEITPRQFLEGCEQVLHEKGFTREEYPAVFLPDTYEFYWTATAPQVVTRIWEHYNDFWNKEREDKAARLGLSPVQVATIASIAEEESAKQDERGKIGRLYINRFKKGMRLQADPTVKFAIGDFTIRRITNVMLSTESPYNTYRVNGLPPGPIRLPSGSTIDGILDSQEHDYLYMCAREDFSGYHNFSRDYAGHMNNARRYRAELDRRNIK